MLDAAASENQEMVVCLSNDGSVGIDGVPLSMGTEVEKSGAMINSMLGAPQESVMDRVVTERTLVPKMQCCSGENSRSGWWG